MCSIIFNILGHTDERSKFRRSHAAHKRILKTPQALGKLRLVFINIQVTQARLLKGRGHDMYYYSGLRFEGWNVGSGLHKHRGSQSGAAEVELPKYALVSALVYGLEFEIISRNI
jgi:hypothetical protein